MIELFLSDVEWVSDHLDFLSFASTTKYGIDKKECC